MTSGDSKKQPVTDASTSDITPLPSTTAPKAPDIPLASPASANISILPNDTSLNPKMADASSSASATLSSAPMDLATAPASNGTAIDEPTVPSADVEMIEQEAASAVPPLQLQFKWSSKTFNITVYPTDLVYDMKSAIQTLTSVEPSAQKILGLVRGKLSVDMDSVRLGTLGIKDAAKFTLIGTPEHMRFKEREGPPPADEFDLEYPSRGRGGLIPPALDPRNLRQVQQVIQKRPITVMNEPRPGKRLLVLDLDYTIADTRPLLDGALPPMECARPGLHAFLEKVYPYYDIVVWSQTHWTWVESKLVELGVIGVDVPYKIAFVADRTSMFPIFSERSGKMVKHEVKPLAYFWARFNHWSAKNTIHIDDLARNFALNPGEGLRIRAFKGAGTHDGMRDRELDKLGEYLTQIAEHFDDFTLLDHSQWKKRRHAAGSNSGTGGAPEADGGSNNDAPDAPDASQP